MTPIITTLNPDPEPMDEPLEGEELRQVIEEKRRQLRYERDMREAGRGCLLPGAWEEK